MVNRIESFFEMSKCKDCLKTMYKQVKTHDQGSSKSEDASPAASTSTSCLVEPSVSLSVREECLSTSLGLDSNLQTLNNNDDANDLVYLGETKYGVQIKKEDLASCTEHSTTPEKLVLNILEYMLSVEDCQKMTVYGSKTKKAMSPSLRKAIRSHLFSIYKKELSEEEKQKYWNDVIVYKMNDKIRGIRNGKYKSKIN